MALTLNAEQKSIYHIFSGETQYIIPPYQRPYSWTKIHCKKLFEDIKKAFYSERNEGYFLGNIVLAKSREEPNRLEVIDGQQRLTTLILLIKVLLTFDKDNKALYNAIWIKDRRTDKEVQRLQTDVFMEQDFNYFKEVLGFNFSTNTCETVNKKDNLFKQNICYFYNILEEFNKYNDVSNFSDFILDHIYLLPIETEDVDANRARKNALQIFETINNRGLNLSSSDIFKAELYSMALNDLTHDIFIEKWKELDKKTNELGYTINDIFEFYQYVIQYEKNIKERIKLKEFFLIKEYSPFFHKKQDVIMNDLLRICDFMLLFVDIVQNAPKYKGLTRWFQLLNQGIQREILNINKYSLYLYFYKSDWKQYDELIEISKRIIFKARDINTLLKIFKRDIKSIEKRIKERVEEENKFINKFKFFKEINEDDIINIIPHEDFFLLLGLYLVDKEKTIYPYYFVNKLINEKKLLEMYPKLNKIENRLRLIEKTYKLIQEVDKNEN